MSGGGGNPRARRLSTRKAHLDHVRNDINVTPLVDVMLVLLIIFMLMTLVMGRGHEVTLPTAKNFSQEPDKQQPVVSVDKDGNLYVEKTNLGPINDATLKEMDNQIRAAWDAPKNEEGVGRVYIKAHNEVTYETIYPVLEYMNKTMQQQTLDLAIAEEKEQ
ncbi:MAG: biopolymer transporter ExbD [Kofleriaceae bacterium]